MRPHYVQQPCQHTGLVAVLMLMAVGTVLVLVPTVVAVPMVVAVIVAVIHVAARNVHAIQDAAKNAFTHVTMNTQMQYRRNNQWLK